MTLILTQIKAANLFDIIRNFETIYDKLKDFFKKIKKAFSF